MVHRLSHLAVMTLISFTFEPNLYHASFENVCYMLNTFFCHSSFSPGVQRLYKLELQFYTCICHNLHCVLQQCK